YNQYVEGGRVRAVHPTPTVGMVGVLRDVARRATQDLKRDGDVLFLLGAGAPRPGAREYLYRLHRLAAAAAPALAPAAGAAGARAGVRGLIAEGVVDTAHDASVGGLAVCLAEMAVCGGRGLAADLPASGAGVLGRDVALFGESSARVVLAVEPARAAAVEEACAAAGVPAVRLGTAGGYRLELRVAGSPAVDLPLASVAAAWRR